MIKNLCAMLDKVLFSPVFKCNHDFINSHCCSGDTKSICQRRYCKKCQSSQIFVDDVWIDSKSLKAKAAVSEYHERVNSEISELNKELEAQQQNLDKQNAEMLANKDMFNANPQRVFNRHKSLKRHYEALRDKRIIAEHLRKEEMQQMSAQIAMLCGQ